MLIETTIALEDSAGVETEYTLKGECYPAEPDVGIMGSYCDDYWLLLDGSEVELGLTDTQQEACLQRLIDVYEDRTDPDPDMDLCEAALAYRLNPED